MRQKMTAGRKKPFRYKGTLGVLCGFLLIAFILFAERSGIQYNSSGIRNAYIEKEAALQAQQVHSTLEKTCLILTSFQDPSAQKAVPELEHILLDMKIGYVLTDASTTEDYDFNDYETVVIALSNLSPMGEKVLELSHWVKNGGSAMLAVTLEAETYSKLLDPKLGIISASYENILVPSIFPQEDFMLGGGRSYPIPNPFQSARSVALNEKTTVHPWTGDERKAPLIWEHPYGQGKFVVVNLGIYEKVVRGFYAAAYSLLTDCTAYPVINGAAFYLDGFPAPVPGGSSSHIAKKYGMSNADFYTNVWWSDMLNLASRYNLKYTGAIIENYENDTTGEITRQRETQKFRYFGNMLLRRQGEIAYHGYNHQPLRLVSTKASGSLPYNPWKDQPAMENALTELVRFTDELFPNTQESVYVPPANILSAGARKMLREDFPEIRTVASLYHESTDVYHQEFGIAQDGMVEQPRLTSGYEIDDYMMLTAVSELNMHLVSNHFLQPNDIFDEKQGSELDWDTLNENLDDYMSWLYTSAPLIEPLTGSQLSGRIQRFAAASLEKDAAEDGYHFKIRNLYDSAYFMVRFNEGTPVEITGGTLEHMTGNLYLLKADAEDVTIRMGR